MNSMATTQLGSSLFSPVGERPPLDQILATDIELMGSIDRLPKAGRRVVAGSHVRTFSAGDLIAAPEELSQNMYILLDGSVDLLVANDKNQRLVASSLGSGAILGDGALGISTMTNVSVEGASDGTVVCVPAPNAHRMVEQHPILGWALLQTYGERQSQVEQNLEDVAYKTLPERLSKMLLEYTDMENGEVVGVSHQNLADRLGTYRETISAILRSFKEDGLVDLGYRRITIRDSESLLDLAGIWDV